MVIMCSTVRSVIRQPEPLTRPEITAMAEQICYLLEDPSVDISGLDRARYQGAVVALETVLGLRDKLGVRGHVKVLAGGHEDVLAGGHTLSTGGSCRPSLPP